MGNGTEKPVGFVSRTLSATEHKYSQIEKDCVVGVTRFHSFLWPVGLSLYPTKQKL